MVRHLLSNADPPPSGLISRPPRPQITKVGFPQCQVVSSVLIQYQGPYPIFLHPLIQYCMSSIAFFSLSHLDNDVALHRIDQLLRHASDFGFFLNASRFRASISYNTLEQPTLSVLHAAYLLGAHISGDETLIAQEPRLLEQALQQRTLLSSTTTTHRRKVLHTVQTDVLLAQYFFRNCRFFEGWSHCNSATSLANGAGLHQLRSRNPRRLRSDLHLVDDAGLELPRPRDAIEDGERINAFWTVYVMDKCWSVFLGSPASILDINALGSQVDTPWPLDMESYELVRPSLSAVITF
jgi:hypothetical protein